MQKNKDIFLSIKDKILQFIKKQGISKEKFFKDTGIAPSNFKGIGMKSELGGNKIVKILSVYDNLNPDWLLLDRGDMLRVGTNNGEKSPKNSAVEIVDSTFLLDRIEKLVVENHELKKEVECLKNNKVPLAGPYSYPELKKEALTATEPETKYQKK